MSLLFLSDQLKLAKVSDGVYRVVNTPVLIQRADDGYWDTFVPIEGGDRFTIALACNTRGEAVTVAQSFLDRAFKGAT